MDIEQINQKRQKLKDCSIYLKQQFIGLDNVIDEIILNIEAWYILPEMITRPVIINLWGLTGVGKTDLVRKLVRFLGFNDKFVEIQMDTKAGTFDKSIKSRLLNSNIEEEDNGIILLDEIQRFRTIDETGTEITEKDFQDVWMLLSDGKFSGENLKSEMIDVILEILYSKDCRESKNEENKEKEDKFIMKPNDKFVKIENEQKLPIKQRKFNIPIFQARRFKKLLKLNEDLQQIMKMNEDTICNLVLDKIRTSSTDDFQIQYNKCLIFISGNIDEAYKMSDRVNDADISADTLHNHLKKINIINIKKALKTRFKPEQISRFGNTHILYPCLSSNNYYSLIHKCLNETLSFTKDYSSIKIKYDNSLVEFIYRNGVFPAQGVRPVFSTVNSIFNNIIPRIILFAKEHNLNELLLKIHNGDNLIIDGYNFFVRLNGILDKIKKETPIDKKILISVHEAGHAVVYALLFKVCPQEIKSSISSWDGGYMLSNTTNESKSQILDRISVLLAGKEIGRAHV